MRGAGAPKVAVPYTVTCLVSSRYCNATRPAATPWAEDWNTSGLELWMPVTRYRQRITVSLVLNVS